MKPRLAMAAAVGLCASCGPEGFDRGLERDAAQEVAPVDDAGPCAPAFPGDLLYVFDTGVAVFAGLAPPLSALPPNGSWFAYAETGGSAGLGDSSTEWSAGEGHACPGAVALTANFTVYGAAERVMALVNFNANWAEPKAYARLHAWIKVAIPSTGTLDHLDGILLATNTNNYMAFQGAAVAASTFADGEWHEIVRDLVPGPTYVPASINQVGVQVIGKGVPPVSSSAPVATTVYVDDLWLELAPP